MSCQLFFTYLLVSFNETTFVSNTGHVSYQWVCSTLLIGPVAFNNLVLVIIMLLLVFKMLLFAFSGLDVVFNGPFCI
jgi:hypothetical protein